MRAETLVQFRRPDLPYFPRWHWWNRWRRSSRGGEWWRQRGTVRLPSSRRNSDDKRSDCPCSCMFRTYFMLDTANCRRCYTSENYRKYLLRYSATFNITDRNRINGKLWDRWSSMSNVIYELSLNSNAGDLVFMLAYNCVSTQSGFIICLYAWHIKNLIYISCIYCTQILISLLCFED